VVRVADLLKVDDLVRASMAVGRWIGRFRKQPNTPRRWPWPCCATGK